MELLRLALASLRVGTFVFGGGPALVPLLRDPVVFRYGWLSGDEFADAVALGQMTPGPLLVTATFVGWKVGTAGGGVGLGLLYATVATACIFLPSFFMTLAASHQLGRLKGNAGVQRFLKGVEAGIVGLVAAAAVQMGQDAIVGWPQAVLCAIALVVLIRVKIDAGLVVVASGIIGLALTFAGVMGNGSP
jgi:chromate transporter